VSGTRSVGRMSWEEAVHMMRSDLRGIRYSVEEMEDFMERRNRAVSMIVDGFRTRPSEGLRFSLVPAARLKKVWLDYGRMGEVRDEKGLDRIAKTVLDNIAMLDATNALSGHSQEDPASVLEGAGFDDVDPSDDAFQQYITDPDSGAWYVSDYGLPYLHGAYALILRAETPEERLLAVDKALNVVHQRSDLSAWFVEGGEKTLMKVATQT